MVCNKIKLYKGDCLIESDKIESGSVDLILTDLPYGTVKDIKNVNHGMSGKCEWDEVIDTNEIYKVANRILRKNGKMILTAQHPFTNKLINKAIPNVPFNYSMIWEKDHFANALTAKKAPLNYYEDVLVFSKKNCNESKHPNSFLHDKIIKKYGFDFVSNLMLNSGRYKDKASARKNLRKKKSDVDYNKELPNCFDCYLFDYLSKNGVDFNITFNEYKEIDKEFKKKFASTFNLWEGKKYKSNILKYKKDYTGHHPTQKPVLLLEDLIKTFSNESDLVVDLTMGSGSTGVACKNTNRNFIGIEQDENYFNIAQKRIKETEYKLF
jgi:site-specific DNA-methyltransferase (adenine-specific)